MTRHIVTNVDADLSPSEFKDAFALFDKGQTTSRRATILGPFATDI